MSANLAARFWRRLGALITIVGESSWVMFGFFLVASAVFIGAEYVPPLDAFFDTSVGKLFSGGVVYALALLFVLLPVLPKGRAYVRDLLALKRPNSGIFWLPLLMWGAYMAITIAVAIAMKAFQIIDVDQVQETGFDDISLPIEYISAFIALVVVAPIAEELLFRGYLFGRLREKFGFWLTTAVTSIVFGIVHMQWNVGVDVAILSVFLCYLRERTGSIWASMMLHAIKNGVAYYFLFINPVG